MTDTVAQTWSTKTVLLIQAKDIAPVSFQRPRLGCLKTFAVYCSCLPPKFTFYHLGCRV